MRARVALLSGAPVHRSQIGAGGTPIGSAGLRGAGHRKPLPCSDRSDDLVDKATSVASRSFCAPKYRNKLALKVDQAPACSSQRRMVRAMNERAKITASPIGVALPPPGEGDECGRPNDRVSAGPAICQSNLGQFLRR